MNFFIEGMLAAGFTKKEIWALIRGMLVVMCVALNACNTLHRITNPEHQSSSGPAPLATDYQVTGTTSINYQIIAPVRCVDSTVRVWVKKPSAADFRELNRYEFKIHTEGVGGGGIEFTREAIANFAPNGDLLNLFISTNPTAPAGTQYKIESTLMASAQGLY
jgi:hypothetical protein